MKKTKLIGRINNLEFELEKTKHYLKVQELLNEVLKKGRCDQDFIYAAINEIKQNKKHHYRMCKPQPVQLECRNDTCKHYNNGACINEAPAITIINDKVTCWTNGME